MICVHKIQNKMYQMHNSEWVIPEKIHTPLTDGTLEILTGGGGGSKALEILAGGGVGPKILLWGSFSP